MWRTLKQTIQRLTPNGYLKLRGMWYNLRHLAREMKIWITPGYPYKKRRVLRRFVRRYGWVVQAGPFAGLTFPPGRARTPTLVGSYEAELHHLIEKVIAANYSVVVNVGASVGYYAIGFAMRMPKVQILAFEMHDGRRDVCRETATINGVASRVSLLGGCDPEQLRAHLPERAFVLADCEGCEFNLFRPDLVPTLQTCDLLIEIHDFLDPRISGAIRSRFATTHEIVAVESRQKDPKDFPSTHFLSTKNQKVAVDEDRPGPSTQWFYLKSRSNMRDDSHH